LITKALHIKAVISNEHYANKFISDKRLEHEHVDKTRWSQS